MNFVRLTNIDGNPVAINLDTVSEMIEIPGTYDENRKTRILYIFMVENNHAFSDVTQTIDEILDH